NRGPDWAVASLSRESAPPPVRARPNRRRSRTAPMAQRRVRHPTNCGLVFRVPRLAYVDRPSMIVEPTLGDSRPAAVVAHYSRYFTSSHIVGHVVPSQG